MARNGIICSILIVYFMVVMPTTGQYCPKDSNPIIEDQTNCTFQIHNDTTAVQNLLKMVANWNDESTQYINIPIILSLNDTELTSHHRIRLHEWVIRNINPDRPPYYISWRTDFKVLSFGLLNEKVDSNPEFTLAIDETEGACTFQYGSESTTREIVRTVSNYIRESKLLDKTYEYENINMCFLSVFEWFKNSPWYIMKQYFGLPFQEFGNKCCKLYHQTVCCNDKLYNINGYRLIPYTISVILICYVPLILLKVAKINHTLHPNQYYDFDNISDNDSQLHVDPSFMSKFENIFCIINTKSKEITNYINWFKLRFGRILFVVLLPCGIYFEFIMFQLSKEWKPKIEDINTENVLFGFTTMLVNIKTNTFLYPIGPLGFLIIYYLTGIIILVLPENFEENIVKKGIVDCIRIIILEKLNQQEHKNLPGYKQLKRVLTTCMFMVFNSKFWTTCVCMVSDCISITCIGMVFNCKFWITCTRIMLLPFLALPVFPFTIIIFIGYAKFVMSKVCCKYFTCTCNNNLDGNNQLIDAEQTQPNVENNKDMGAEQNQTTVENNKDKGAKRNQIHETIFIEQNQAIDVNNKNIGAEQKQNTDENTKDIGADNNATCKCCCTCKTFMKIVYCCCSVLLMALFVYLVAVIVSYTVYIIVYAFYFTLWALVTSHTETSSFLIFVFGEISFFHKIVKDGISFYKELFNLTIEVCQQNEDWTKNKYIKLQNGIIYIDKDIVRTIQQAIYPFYIFIGYTIMELIAVGLLYYLTYFFAIRSGIHDIFLNFTTVITSALPTLVASQFKHKLPNKNIVKDIVHCFQSINP